MFFFIVVSQQVLEQCLFLFLSIILRSLNRACSPSFSAMNRVCSCSILLLLLLILVCFEQSLFLFNSPLVPPPTCFSGHLETLEEDTAYVVRRAKLPLTGLEWHRNTRTGQDRRRGTRRHRGPDSTDRYLDELEPEQERMDGDVCWDSTNSKNFATKTTFKKTAGRLTSHGMQ